jgi:predicted acetyltransferase
VTTLRPVVTGQERQVLGRLWQLYSHDLSEFRGSLPDGEGLFRAGRLPTYLTDADRACHLVVHDGAVVGFGLVRGLAVEPRVLGEFFVVRAVRGAGVGAAAARLLLAAYPGRWEVAFQEANPAAARFWRRVAAEVAGDTWGEEERSVPDKPEIPPDVWLTLTV